MKLPSLPQFEVPDLPSKAIPRDVYDDWVTSGYADAVKSGAVDNHRGDPQARPVDKRFSFRQ
ncbi:MAG: hypothetical protein HN341_02440 [Verrucomicrobia bacterium]|jgi:hypothetical protein|nr:hypothetical protein [Verrucomicrobiota bacterium]